MRCCEEREEVLEVARCLSRCQRVYLIGQGATTTTTTTTTPVLASFLCLASIFATFKSPDDVVVCLLEGGI